MISRIIAESLLSQSRLARTNSKQPLHLHVIICFIADVSAVDRENTWVLKILRVNAVSTSFTDKANTSAALHKTQSAPPPRMKLPNATRRGARALPTGVSHIFISLPLSNTIRNGVERERRSLEREIGMLRSRDAEAELNLPPGFRFHPTDEELVVYYLCRRAAQQNIPVPIIAEVDLYKYDPWDLPEKALFGTREWYFFTPRERKYPNGSRPNRAAGRGYWKATGADKPVALEGGARPVGIKKALVFYKGKAPRGVKTDWIMHEYRLADTNRSARRNGSLRLDDWVLCRLYNKKNSWKKMQREATDSAEDESLRTLESDIEFPEFDDIVDGEVDQNQSSGMALLTVAPSIKEEDDWYSELNLDDLKNPAIDVSNHEYYYLPSFVSPKAIASLPPF